MKDKLGTIKDKLDTFKSESGEIAWVFLVVTIAVLVFTWVVVQC